MTTSMEEQEKHVISGWFARGKITMLVLRYTPLIKT